MTPASKFVETIVGLLCRSKNRKLEAVSKVTLQDMTPLAVSPTARRDEDGCINPFLYDDYHMGLDFSKGTMIMMANHPSENGEYMILVNKRTGERKRILFPENWQ